MATRRIDGKRASGALTVEYAMTAPMLLLLMFLLLEIARALFLFNSVQEVTRRAARGAAVTDFTSQGALDAVRRNAIFRNSDGELFLSGGLTQDHVVIDYLWQDSTGALQPLAGALPASPAQNRINCMASPDGGNCIQFVRVRICTPGACAPVQYLPLLSWLSTSAVTLPLATTVVRAESLGYRTCISPCP